MRYVYTPTTSVRVINKLDYTIEVSGCGDPATISPGGQASVEAIGDLMIRPDRRVTDTREIRYCAR